MTAARAAFASGNLQLAESSAQQILAERHDHLPTLELLAQINLSKGDPASAKDYAERALRVSSGSLVARHTLAHLARMAGNLSEAADLFESLSELAPDDFSVFNDLGLCQLALGRSQQAVTALQRAVQLSADNAPLHHNLGTAFASLGLYESAAECFRESISLSPGNPQSYISLAHVAIANRHKHEAIQLFRKAYELSPATVQGHLQLAQALIIEERIEEAVQVLESVVRQAPKLALAHGLLGKAYQRLGRFDEARNSIERAIELQPQRVGYFADYVAATKITEADRDLLLKMEACVPKDSGGADTAIGSSLSVEDRRSVFFSIGKAHDDLGEYEEAFQAFQKANQIAFESLAGGRRLDRDAYRARIDAIISSIDEIEGLAQQNVGGEPVPIFIVGMMRSGTTLVDQILTSHRHVQGCGELSYWTDPARERQNPREAGADYLNLLRREAPNATWITDKMPDNYLALGLIRKALPNAKVIHVHRSPMDNCLSIYTTPFMPPAFAHIPADTAFVYQEYLRLMNRWESVMATKWIQSIRYEDLVLDRERVIRKMLEFCGLEWDEACLNHDQNKRSIVTPSAWQARQPVYSSSIGRWRHYQPWLEEFETVLPLEMAYFGVSP